MKELTYVYDDIENCEFRSDNPDKFYNPFGTCVACGSHGVDLHHVKTQKSGGSDESWNLLPLCHLHHVMVHNIGLSDFCKKMKLAHGVDGRKVKAWLWGNGWEFCKFRGKWINQKYFVESNELEAA